MMPVIEASLSDEDYIIQRAKNAQKSDPYAAKAWMLTAKTLFPSNFTILFEAYLMEKTAGNVKESAECFTSLIPRASRPIPNELWPEIDAITTALKTSQDGFLTQMFEKIHPDTQHKILLATAEHSEDTMEHCRIILLLLKKFPHAVATHSANLVETLLSAEKHSSDSRYARLLIVDTLPYLTNSQQSPRLLKRLLIKAIQFYNGYMTDGQPGDISDPWQRLYAVLELFGRQLGWDPYLVNFNNTLNKELYFQKLILIKGQDDCRQLLYCGTIFLLQCLQEENVNKGSHVLVEAFTDPDVLTNRRKGEIEVTGVPAMQFQAAASCWELLNCNDIIAHEFIKLTNQLTVKIWEGPFKSEFALYRLKYDEAIPPASDNSLSANLIRACVAFCQGNNSVCLDSIVVALSQLPTTEGSLESELVVGGTHRHLHFLPLTKVAVVHYCCTLLLRALVATGSTSDLTIGHMLVLMQLGWPQDETVFLRLMDAIRQRGVLHYPLFQTYIIHIDILEELIYMWNEPGGNVVLDIIPAQQHLGQRRIGTRGADKGVKEDFKQAIKSQVARCNESIINLAIQFMTQERLNILPCFI